jgi:hypothetical protein
VQAVSRGINEIRRPKILITVGDRKGTHLSFRIFAVVAFDDGEGAEAKQLAKRLDLQRLPVIHSLVEVHKRSSQVFLVDRIVGGIEHHLDGIDGSIDVGLEVGVFRLFPKFLFSY